MYANTKMSPSQNGPPDRGGSRISGKGVHMDKGVGARLKNVSHFP